MAYHNQKCARLAHNLLISQGRGAASLNWVSTTALMGRFEC
jgi:hypothetical protein